MFSGQNVPWWQLHGGWMIFTLGLLATAFLTVIGLVGQTVMIGAALVTLGLSSWFFDSLSVKIIDPNIGMLFRTGRLVEVLGAGRYFPLWFNLNIVEIPTGWQIATPFGLAFINQPEGQTNVPVGFRTQITYRPKIDRSSNNSANDSDRNSRNRATIEQILLMPPEMMEQQAEALIIAAVNNLLADKRSFKQAVTDKSELEQSLAETLRPGFARYGYELGQFRLIGYDDNVLSQAAAKVVTGRAEAEVEQAKVVAVTESLQNNWPAALYMSVKSGQLGNTVNSLQAATGKALGLRQSVEQTDDTE